MALERIAHDGRLDRRAAWEPATRRQPLGPDQPADASP